MLIFFLFFFFQAEDGIRDLYVTGVQTCALPIWARRRGSAHIRQLVVPGDGAVWIWNLADELFPAATQIVDLYHAREHAHDLATLATRLPRDSHPDWLAERLAQLGTGNIP